MKRVMRVAMAAFRVHWIAWGAGLVLIGIGQAVSVWAAEIIELRNGYKIEADVLKETPEEIFIDLGVEVIRVPLNQVLRRYRPEEQAHESSDDPAPADRIYHCCPTLESASVKALTERLGGAVVMVRTPSGLGSGFIINEDGYCLTNYHVIERETRITVTVFQKRDKEFVRRRIDEVEIVALNPFLDLALLRIPEQPDLDFPYVYLAADSRLRSGEPVFAIGNPMGFERSVSQGIVSTQNRNFGGLTYVQTTAEINPGNSGGPLFNLRGEVVGVTNMKLLFSEGLGFAIPIAYVKHFLDNRDAFAFDRDNPNTGYRYLDPPRRRRPETPPGAEQSSADARRPSDPPAEDG